MAPAADAHGSHASVAGLILAAGGSTRFGAGSKLLADLGGRPLLQWAVDAQLAVASLGRVVVVLGAHAGDVRSAVRFGRASVVVCDAWATGQSASLRRGLDELRDADNVVVTLGDAPLISAAVIERFAAEPGGTRAVYDGRPGHPVVLGADQVAALVALKGDRGARDLLRAARTIEVGHLCSGRDVDTPEDLEAVRGLVRSGRRVP